MLKDVHAIREVLSAILHLGNIEFDVDEATDELDIVDESHFLHGNHR